MEHLRNKAEHWKMQAVTLDTQQLQMLRQLAASQQAHDDMAAQLAAKQRLCTEAEQQLASLQTQLSSVLPHWYVPQMIQACCDCRLTKILSLLS